MTLNAVDSLTLRCCDIFFKMVCATLNGSHNSFVQHRRWRKTSVQQNTGHDWKVTRTCTLEYTACSSAVVRAAGARDTSDT